jgi:hypothetical protein
MPLRRPSKGLMRATSVFLALLLTACLPWPAWSQGTDPATRAEVLRRERERKQQESKPNQPDGLQRGLNYIEDRALLLVARDGFHPQLGSLTPGSGFAFGGGYRSSRVFDRHGSLDIWAAGSLKKYWAMEARATFPHLANRRVMAEGLLTMREYPREAFFGLGPDSRRADETSFLFRTAEVSGRAGVRLAPPVTVGGGVGLVTPRTGPSHREDVISISDLFTPRDVPGLGARVDFIRTSGFVEVDYRRPRNARQGGWYRVDLSRFADRDGGTWSFRRTDVDLQQFIGFFADRRVIALRGYLSSSSALDDSRGVPFFMMPTLGGNDTLRGFRTYRFRGPHALLLQAEYRWEVWSGLDAALFYDAGQVAMRRSDLKLGRLESDYGFGFRFNTANGVIMRVDAAFGSRDGKHLHIVFGGVF